MQPRVRKISTSQSFSPNKGQLNPVFSVKSWTIGKVASKVSPVHQNKMRVSNPCLTYRDNQRKIDFTLSAPFAATSMRPMTMAAPVIQDKMNFSTLISLEHLSNLSTVTVSKTSARNCYSFAKLKTRSTLKQSTLFTTSKQIPNQLSSQSISTPHNGAPRISTKSIPIT